MVALYKDVFFAVNILMKFLSCENNRKHLLFNLCVLRSAEVIDLAAYAIGLPSCMLPILIATNRLG